ncbi:secreted RxLR effector protein 161-like [Miscanthus floridulus]|uniref:secreted RxLR effector protein 161-like n=1 Tax=Miscanthus floridulus TaxID=154761 RepID=UPI003458D159
MEHQQAVKRIIRYIAGTLNHGLYYPRCPGVAHFVGYSDSDHAGDIDTSKSTSGILFFLGKCLVSWQSVKQQVVALSSYKAEYIAASTASTQALWLARLLGDLLGRDTRAVELRVDSKSALALAKNPMFHECSKHIREYEHEYGNPDLALELIVTGNTADVGPNSPEGPPAFTRALRML